jgi:periplasmic mercuric ion binding protein
MIEETAMIKLLASTIVVSAWLTVGAAFAGERIVTLDVQNMYCATCPYTVKKSLERAPGVSKVVVSYEDKTATVTYDDAVTDVKSLTAATANAGYPSAPKS